MNGHAPELSGLVRAMIAERRAALEQLETAIGVYDRAFGNGHMNVTDASPKKAGGRRKALAPGSLPDRIVAILTEAGEPLKSDVIVAQAKAKKYSVRLALKALIAERRVIGQGATASRKYALS